MSFDLPPHEKTAFFSILDEYFAQRPHLDPMQLGQGLAPGSVGGTHPPGGASGPPPVKGAKPSPFLAAQAPARSYGAPAPQRDPDAIGEAEAIYAYPKSEVEDLELTKGERITLIEKVSDDWWRGRSQDGQRREGIVPSTYVRVL